MYWFITILISDWFYNLVGSFHHVSVSCRDIPQNVEWTGGNFGVSDKNLIEVAEYIRSHDIDAA